MIIRFITVIAFLCAGLASAAEPADKKAESRSIVVTIPENECEYKLIPLKTMSYGTVDQICRPWLSGEGKLVHEKRRGSILVYDYPEIIAKIEKFIGATDRDPVNIRLDVDFIGSKSRSDRGLNINTGRGGQNHLVFNDGKLVKPKGGMKITPTWQNTNSSSNTSQILVTSSGHPATLWVGKTVVDPSWLNNLKLNPTVIVQGDGGGVVVIPGTDVDFRWADVGASLQALPTYFDDGTIEVEIYPVVSHLDGKGRKQAVKVESVATKVRVKSGQRIDIGGLVGGKREQYNNLFGPRFFESIRDSDVLNMYLTATAMSPDGRGLRGKR